MNKSLYNQYKILVEKKDHIIKKLKNLTDEEKAELINFFSKKPNLESKIDWNNPDLTFDDFKEVMKDTITQKKKTVKSGGIKGLVKGTDYLEFPMPQFFADESIKAYIPLNHNASKLIAGKDIGNCVGKWCTAQNKKNYWNKYVYKNGIILIYVLYEHKNTVNKYAIAVSLKLKENGQQYLEIFDEEDDSLTSWQLNNILHLNISEVIDKNIDIIETAQEIIIENRKNISMTDIINEITVDCFYDTNEAQYIWDENFTELDTGNRRDNNLIWIDYGNMSSHLEPYDVIDIDITRDEIINLLEKEGEDPNDYSDEYTIWDYIDDFQFFQEFDEIIEFLDENKISYTKNYEIVNVQEYNRGEYYHIYVNTAEFERVSGTVFKSNEYRIIFDNWLNGVPLNCTAEVDGETIYSSFDGEYDFDYDKETVIKDLYDKITNEFEFIDSELDLLMQKLEEEVPEQPRSE